MICGALLAALVPASVMAGTVGVDPGTAWRAITAFDPANTQHLLVVELRIPRTVLAIAVAIALGMAGLIMQALTRNPLADPGVLGVNAGAAAATAAAITLLGIVDAAGYMWFSLAGALLAGIAVALLGGVRSGADPVRLVLAGAAITIVLTGVTAILIVNSPEEVYSRFRAWAAGSVAGRSSDALLPAGLLMLAGAAIACSLPRALDTAALGSELGQALGLRARRVWVLATLSVVLLAGGATAASGPIVFAGLIAPHLARFLTGPEHRWAMPYTALIAACLMLAADVLGRIAGQPGEVSVGVMIELLGGPFFIFFVRGRRIARL